MGTREQSRRLPPNKGCFSRDLMTEGVAKWGCGVAVPGTIPILEGGREQDMAGTWRTPKNLERGGEGERKESESILYLEWRHNWSQTTIRPCRPGCRAWTLLLDSGEPWEGFRARSHMARLCLGKSNHRKANSVLRQRTWAETSTERKSRWLRYG